MRKYYFAIIIVCIILIIAIGAQLNGYAADMPPVQASFDSRQEVCVPILMYHNISAKKGAQGKFVISPTQLDKDLDTLIECGFSTVVFADTINYVKNGYSLPAKPIVLTFDDGDMGVYNYAYPALKARNMKAVVSVIGEITDRFSENTISKSFPNLRWKEICELKDSGIFEIANHTYALHKNRGGAAKRAGESNKRFNERISSDLDKMQKRLQEQVGSSASVFVYPFGKMSKGSRDILKQIGFKGSLSCIEGVNTFAMGDDSTLWEMKRINRSHGRNLDCYLAVK